MFCNNCGAEVKSDSKYCNSCGKGLDPIVTGRQNAWAGPTKPARRTAGRKHLIVALSAVAAVAAVAVYERLARSLPPDPHAAQKSTTVATLNSVQAAVADGTKDTQLTRPVALTLLQKDMSTWRGTIMCSLNWALPPLATPGEMRDQQALIATGYFTEPRFSMEMWGNGSYHKSNSGVMALTSKSKNWDVNGDSVVAIPAAIPVVTQITGISRNGNAAQITFMWHWVPNPQLSDLANADQVLFAKINRLEQSNSTGLELFDDGWRTGNPMFETYSFGEQHRTVVLGSCN